MGAGYIKEANHSFLGTSLPLAIHNNGSELAKARI